MNNLQKIIKTGWKKIWKKYKAEIILISLSFLIMLVSLIVFFYNQFPKTNDEELIQPVEKVSQLTNQKIYIDIGGAVKKPNVYKLNFGARIKDVLELAGGFSEEADQSYFIRNFNLSKVLNDQEKIYIPSLSETSSGIFVENPQVLQNLQANYSNDIPISQQDLININEASEQELDKLPGVGKVTANKIISARPYSKIEDLIEKKVLNQSVFEKIKGLIQI